LLERKILCGDDRRNLASIAKFGFSFELNAC